MRSECPNGPRPPERAPGRDVHLGAVDRKRSGHGDQRISRSIRRGGSAPGLNEEEDSVARTVRADAPVASPSAEPSRAAHLPATRVYDGAGVLSIGNASRGLRFPVLRRLQAHAPAADAAPGVRSQRQSASRRPPVCPPGSTQAWGHSSVRHDRSRSAITGVLRVAGPATSEWYNPERRRGSTS
jgi:hypothetical protein